MINVSNEFKELMKQRQDFKGNAEVTLLNGTVLKLDETDFSISNNGIVDAADANAVPLGTAICRNIQLELLNDDDHLKEYDFFGAKVRLYLTFQLSGTTEKIEFGTFTVTAPESYGSTVIVTAYDDMHKANAAYQTKLVFPATTGAVLRDICTNCGIVLASALFLHNDFVIQENPSSEYTFRQVIGFIAMIACGNARINRNGKLEILSYDLDFAKPHHELTEWISLTLDTSDITITGVTTTRKITADDGTETEEVVEAGKKGYQLTVSNPLAKGSEQTLVSWIAERLSGIPFRKFTGDYITYPLAEFMDLAVISDWRGNTYNTFLTDIDFVFFGITTMKNSAESGLRNQSAYSNEQAGTNVYFKELVEKEKTAREEAVKKLDETLKKGSGLYSTYEKQPDGSIISYFHDKPTVEESQNVIKITSDAIGVSNDGGKTYPYGFVLDGDLITKILYAEGINADYIDAGALTVSDESGKILFMVDMDTKQVVIDGDHLQIGGLPLSEVIMDTKTIVLSLDNNYQSVPVDNEGNYEKFPDVTFRPTVHYGFEDITKDCNFTISKSDYVQGAWDNTSKTFKVTGLTADDGWVDVRATYLNRFTDLKRFTLAKVYAGEEGPPGKDGRTYILESSAQIVKVAKDNKVVPSYIDFYSKYQDGQSANRHAYKGRFRIRETADGNTWRTVYQSAQDETSVRHNLYTFILTNTGNPILASNGKAIGIYREIAQIEVTLYAAGGFTTMIDIQNIVTVKDIDNLSPEQVFDILTDNGKVQGIYKEGGQIYVNGEFIQARGFRAVDKSGNVTFYINDNGEVTVNATSLSIRGRAGATQEYADSAASSAVNKQTQEFVFNKLSNDGKVKGIWLENNQLYINGDYIVTGIIRDKKGLNYWNLNTGDFALQGYATDSDLTSYDKKAKGYASAAQTNANNYTSNQVKNAMDSLTAENVYNRLTNNGQVQGIWRQNGKLYLNADYLTSGTIKGIDLISENGKEWFKISQSIATGGYGSTIDGLLDLSAQYGDDYETADRNVVLEARTYDLIFKAKAERNIIFESGNVEFWDKVLFKNEASFETFARFKGSAIFSGASVFNGGATFEKGITFNSSVAINGDLSLKKSTTFNQQITFMKASKMYYLQHVSSGANIVFASDGATLAYLASSSHRYKNHVREMDIEEALRALDIPVVWFKYKEGYLSSEDRFNDKPIPGFYAEDVLDYFSEAAQLNIDGQAEDWNYRVMIPIMMKLIQHLYEREEKPCQPLTKTQY